MDGLTEQEAFLAMYAYLKPHLERTKSDELACLLSDLSLLPDGGTADPAAWQDWLSAVEKVKRGRVDARLILNKSENHKKC